MNITDYIRLYTVASDISNRDYIMIVLNRRQIIGSKVAKLINKPAIFTRNSPVLKLEIRTNDYLADVGGQYCPYHVLASLLSGFSGKYCLDSVRCLDCWSLSVYPAGQGRDRAVQTFGVTVRRCLLFRT